MPRYLKARAPTTARRMHAASLAAEHKSEQTTEKSTAPKLGFVTVKGTAVT